MKNGQGFGKIYMKFKISKTKKCLSKIIILYAVQNVIRQLYAS
jgi:hypothetical protein